MKEKKLLLGNEAVAMGAVNAGISGVYAYPGTPSTEITEYIQSLSITKKRGIYSRWCTNEKVALETALGVSYVGKRVLVCMKHVGLNVAADPFMNGIIAGANGGIVLVTADDPSMHSSQNEQDNRFYSKFGFCPCLEPSNQQEAYDMMNYGFELSEKNNTLVLLRITTRMAHSRSIVEIDAEAKPIAKEIKFPAHPNEWITLPANTRKKYPTVLANYNELEEKSLELPFNNYFEGKSTKLGIIASGIANNYLRENIGYDTDYPVLKICQYPFPKKQIVKMAEQCESLLIIEEGQPVIEEMVRGVFPTKTKIMGRLSGELPRAGELSPDDVRVALGMKVNKYHKPSENVVPRPPALCEGCGHRDVYNSLNEVLRSYPNHKVFSDIGCYTLGALPPFRSINTCIDMGASITMAKGAADAGLYPSVAVIGDSTFTHSGMTGLLDAVNVNADMTIIISDNLTTAMTGGQDSAGTGRLEDICRGIGVNPDHLRVVIPTPKTLEEVEKVLKEEIEYHGLSVVIPRRECIQSFRRHAKERKKNAK
ncbi:MAG: thiamine pyrophosphate-dependent enzyme [Bacteroidales bacterium]